MDGRLRGRDAGVNITNGVKTTVTIFCSHLLPHLIKREQMRAKNKKNERWFQYARLKSLSWKQQQVRKMKGHNPYVPYVKVGRKMISCFHLVIRHHKCARPEQETPERRSEEMKGSWFRFGRRAEVFVKITPLLQRWLRSASTCTSHDEALWPLSSAARTDVCLAALHFSLVKH